MLTTGFDGGQQHGVRLEDRVARGGQDGRLLGADRDEAVRRQLGAVPHPPLLEVDRPRACGPVAGSSTTTWVSTAVVRARQQRDAGLPAVAQRGETSESG